MTWILALLGVYIALMLVTAWISLHPLRTPALISPGAIGAPQEDVEFTSDRLTLRGWWVDCPGSECVVVLAHGYMMNRSELAPVAWQLWQHRISSLSFDFRAHGHSGGKKCALGVDEARDVAAAVRYARNRRPNVKIVLLGSSMGAAASAIACGQEPDLADALILDSAYSRLSSAILGWWRFLGGQPLAVALAPTVAVAAPMAGFNPYLVDVSKFLAQCGSLPVLVIHGDRDNLALPSEAEKNFAACRGAKELVWFAGCRHCEGRWEQPDKYLAAVLQFIQQSLSATGALARPLS